MIWIGRHRVALLLTLALAIGAGVAAPHGWAWYHYRAAESALAHYQNDAARAHLKKCLAVWPDDPAAHLLAARAERRVGNLTAAQVHLDECRKQATGDEADAIAFEWALLRAAMGDLAPVEEPLQARLLKRPAEAPLIWEALVAGYRRTCRMPEALVCLDTWLRFEPDNAQAYFLRGEVHRQVGAVNRSRDEYQRALELAPDHAEARRRLVRSLVKIGRYQEASEHLHVLLVSAPGDPDLETLLAHAEHDLGQRAEAIARLDAVLQAHPEHGPALRERGRLALAAGDFTAAEDWLRQALRVLPHDNEVHWGLQRALKGQGRTAEAKAELAVAQGYKDRLERISAIQTREMSLHPYDAALQAELGELLLSIGQDDSAERWLQSALRLAPDSRAARAALARLHAQRAPAPAP